MCSQHLHIHTYMIVNTKILIVIGIKYTDMHNIILNAHSNTNEDKHEKLRKFLWHFCVFHKRWECILRTICGYLYVCWYTVQVSLFSLSLIYVSFYLKYYSIFPCISLSLLTAFHCIFAERISWLALVKVHVYDLCLHSFHTTSFVNFIKT